VFLERMLEPPRSRPGRWSPSRRWEGLTVTGKMPDCLQQGIDRLFCRVTLDVWSTQSEPLYLREFQWGRLNKQRTGQLKST